MTIKKLFIAWLAACFAGIGLSGCGENVVEKYVEGETADVTLRLDFGQDKLDVSRATDANASEHEGIKTLRVFVVDRNGDIVYNKKLVDLKGTDTPLLQESGIMLEDIPVGPSEIYAVANEESLGIECTDEWMAEHYVPVVINEVTRNKLLFVDEQTPHKFPKTYNEIADCGLPITGFVQNVEVMPQMEAVTISMRRAVVKLNLVVENGLETPMTLEKVNYGAFAPDRVYLFSRYMLDVPSGTINSPMVYNNLGINLPAGGESEPFVVYIYPTFAYRPGMTNSPYTLSITAGGTTYNPLRFTTANSFGRNTQVNIRARITAPANVTLDFEVLPWEPYSVDVPDFN